MYIYRERESERERERGRERERERERQRERETRKSHSRCSKETLDKSVPKDPEKRTTKTLKTSTEAYPPTIKWSVLDQKSFAWFKRDFG